MIKLPKCKIILYYYNIMRVSNKKRVFKKRGTLKKTRKFKKYGGSGSKSKNVITQEEAIAEIVEAQVVDRWIQI